MPTAARFADEHGLLKKLLNVTNRGKPREFSAAVTPWIFKACKKI
jgi:hypothetical protein